MRSKRAILNISTNLILQIIVILYGFIVPKIIITNYGSNVNGLVSSITQFLAYIALLDSGFTSVVKAQLYKPIAEKNNKDICAILKTSEKFFKKIAYIFIIYIFVLAFLYPMLVNSNFDYFYTLILIIILSISTFSEYYFGMVYRMFLQADQKSYVISIIQIITYIFTIIITIFLSKLGVSIQLLKLVTAAIFVFRPILQNIYVRVKYDFNFKESKENYQIKNKWDGLAQHIASVVHSNTDITVLTIFCNLVEVSVYSVYYLVVKGLKSIIQSFTSGIDSTFGDILARNEIKNLNDRFNTYEVLYSTIITICYSCSIVLIIPFVSIYTKNVHDVNYIRYVFGYLIIISEFIWAIRQPYNELIKAAGHFKETKVGAWVECITNIIISIILVNKYGLVGVAIGTTIAMIIRTCEFIYHANKYILNRSYFKSLKQIFISIFETISIVIIFKYIKILPNISYINLFINAIIVLGISFLLVLCINMIFYKNEYRNLFSIISKLHGGKNNDKKNI